jgi:type IV pilus assembly protein PilV
MRHGFRGDASGGFLLEALVALLIFSFGLLAMAGLHARAVRHFNDAQYRADAADVVHEALSFMRASNPATLADRFDRSNGAQWRVLLDQAKRLPGVTDSQNVPTLEFADGPTAGSRQASLQVFWQAPDDRRAHSYGSTIMVGAN